MCRAKKLLGNPGTWGVLIPLALLAAFYVPFERKYGEGTTQAYYALLVGVVMIGATVGVLITRAIKRRR